MANPDTPPLHTPPARWVRLETLARVRWLAVMGQLGAIIVAYFGLGLQFNLLHSLAVVGISAGSNVLGWASFPRSRRLSEPEALLLLAFDTVQLSLLLYITGGLNNPFALLLLAPVTIASTVLQLRSTLALGALSVIMATVLVVAHDPLLDQNGAMLVLPPLFLFGFWLAIVIGVAFIGLYLRSVAAEKQALAEALQATQMALAREQRFTELSGVVAAAAHELGTPLATIKLASGELVDALADDPEALEDAHLIRTQVERCHAILRSMGSAGKDDLHLRQAPLEAILQEAAAPHADRGKALHFRVTPLPDCATDPGPMPEIWRNPGLVHGVRNLIQNAVDFAKAEVQIAAHWDAERIFLRISDDGPGFQPQLLGRIGEPFLRDRRESLRVKGRSGYQGMGLGLFIAKTLLERSGGEVRFGNADTTPDNGNPAGGAVITLEWPRTAIEARARPALGVNQPLD
ncbi:MAG: ActS/PrrB/RegB family redox-sensitive histidine kinase [Pararhodobacter sp.]|nr:ActS/PrrB/RegB family redox-sensitive histidine kinase [Pararhodobacter sp.]